METKAPMPTPKNLDPCICPQSQPFYIQSDHALLHFDKQSKEIMTFPTYL